MGAVLTQPRARVGARRVPAARRVQDGAPPPPASHNTPRHPPFVAPRVQSCRTRLPSPAAALAAAALAAAFLAAARWTEGREASRLKTSRVGALPRPARPQRRRPPGGLCLQQLSQGVLHRRGGLPVLVAGAASLQGQRQGQGELKSEPLRSQRSPPLLCRLPSLDRASAPRASPRPAPSPRAS